MVDPTLAEMGKNLNEAMKMLEDNQRCVGIIGHNKKQQVFVLRGGLFVSLALSRKNPHFPGSLRSHCHSEAYTCTNHLCFSNAGIFQVNVYIFMHVL